MTWRYCITRTTTPDGYWYEVREVYYNAEGEVEGWTVDEVAPCGDSVNDVRSDLERMTEALHRPILDISADPPVWIDV